MAVRMKRIGLRYYYEQKWWRKENFLDRPKDIFVFLPVLLRWLFEWREN